MEEIVDGRKNEGNGWIGGMEMETSYTLEQSLIVTNRIKLALRFF